MDLTDEIVLALILMNFHHKVDISVSLIAQWGNRHQKPAKIVFIQFYYIIVLLYKFIEEFIMHWKPALCTRYEIKLI